MTDPPEGDAWAWIRLSEDLASGIHHALNNRLAALGGAVQVLQSDIQGEHSLMGLLSNELRRLETTTALLHLLGPDEGFEPVQVGDILSQAERLFEIHHGLRDLRLELEVAEGLPPIWSVPVGLLRVVMMMIAAVGAGVASGSPWERKEAGVVGLKVYGEASEVLIVAEVAERLEDAELPVMREEDVAPMARRIGGTLRVSEGSDGTRWELRLPTLAEARRREREGGAS